MVREVCVPGEGVRRRARPSAQFLLLLLGERMHSLTAPKFVILDDV